MREAAMNRILFARAYALAALLALAALVPFSCDNNPSDASTDLRIATHSGDNQTERAGSTLPAPLVVRVSDILGNAKPGIGVEFSTHGEPLASVTPQIATTDAGGLASCTFQLGTRAGTQHVWATIAQDSTVLSATAVAVACPEENPAKVCQWPAGHIFIATTSSSLLSGAGSVVIDYNPGTEEITKVLETSNLIDGISFSSRGELFISAPTKIRKVNSTTHNLEAYIDYSNPSYRMSLEPNAGGVLAGLGADAPQRIGCPGSEIQALSSGHTFANILWENLAVDPVTRDVYMMTGSSPTNYVLWRGYWDGRATAIESYDVVANLTVGNAEPRGMCADSSGTIYIVFDAIAENDTYRRIVTVTSSGAVDYDFFNFFTFYGSNQEEAGRWGDIAYLKGRLYVIDRRNDRLVIISKHGTWLGEIKNTAFSRPLDASGHYAICASPAWLCATEK
jgi:hypothetical protein